MVRPKVNDMNPIAAEPRFESEVQPNGQTTGLADCHPDGCGACAQQLGGLDLPCGGYESMAPWVTQLDKKQGPTPQPEGRPRLKPCLNDIMNASHVERGLVELVSAEAYSAVPVMPHPLSRNYGKSELFILAVNKDPFIKSGSRLHYFQWNREIFRKLKQVGVNPQTVMVNTESLLFEWKEVGVIVKSITHDLWVFDVLDSVNGIASNWYFNSSDFREGPSKAIGRWLYDQVAHPYGRLNIHDRNCEWGSSRCASCMECVSGLAPEYGSTQEVPDRLRDDLDEAYGPGAWDLEDVEDYQYLQYVQEKSGNYGPVDPPSYNPEERFTASCEFYAEGFYGEFPACKDCLSKASCSEAPSRGSGA